MNHVPADVQAAKVDQLVQALNVRYCIALKVQRLKACIRQPKVAQHVSHSGTETIPQCRAARREYAYIQIFELGDALVLKVQHVIELGCAAIPAHINRACSTEWRMG